MRSAATSIGIHLLHQALASTSATRPRAHLAVRMLCTKPSGKPRVRSKRAGSCTDMAKGFGVYRVEGLGFRVWGLLHDKKSSSGCLQPQGLDACRTVAVQCMNQCCNKINHTLLVVILECKIGGSSRPWLLHHILGFEDAVERLMAHRKPIPHHSQGLRLRASDEERREAFTPRQPNGTRPEAGVLEPYSFPQTRKP